MRASLLKCKLKREYRTQTGSADCFDSCILAWKILRCLEQGSLFSRPLNCISKSLDGHEPREPAVHTLESEGGEGARSRLPAGPVHCGMVLGWAGRVRGFQVPLRCGCQHASLPCFLWQWGIWLPSNPAIGKAQTSVLSSLQDRILFIIPNLSAKSKMIWCVWGGHFIFEH